MGQRIRIMYKFFSFIYEIRLSLWLSFTSWFSFAICELIAFNFKCCRMLLISKIRLLDFDLTKVGTMLELTKLPTRYDIFSLL